MPRSTAQRRQRSPKKPLTPAAPSASAVHPRTPIGVAIQRRYLTRTEAAGYLGFSIEKLIQLVKAQQLTEYDFGPFCKRYRLEDLEAFAQARRREGLAKTAETLLA
jgi:hypothetical protein